VYKNLSVYVKGVRLHTLHESSYFARSVVEYSPKFEVNRKIINSVLVKKNTKRDQKMLNNEARLRPTVNEDLRKILAHIRSQ